ncbi:MAG: PDZ domain-containing protein [Candidatus Brocadiia bacterium]
MTRTIISIAVGLVLAFAALCIVTAGAETPNKQAIWAEVLGPTQAKWPDVNPHVETNYLDNIPAAMDMATRSLTPIVIELRCPKLGGVPTLNKIEEVDPDAAKMMKYFIKVTLTDLWSADYRYLPFEALVDPDKMHWLVFIGADGTPLGCFGGWEDKAGDSAYIKGALAATMTRILNHYYDTRRPNWRIDPPAPKISGNVMTARDVPSFKSWSSQYSEMAGSKCLHCHTAASIFRQATIDAKKYNKKSDVYIFPHPDCIGLMVSRTDGITIETVVPDSPADKAGIKVGDVLGAANGRRLFSENDLRAVLSEFPGKGGKLPFIVLRQDAVTVKDISLFDGWKKYEIGWRSSIASSNIGASPAMAWALRTPDDVRAKLKIGDDKMGMSPVFGNNPNASPAYAAGLRTNHVVIAINGESPDIWGRSFLVWFRLKFDPGAKVEFTVLDEAGKKSAIKFVAK